MIIHFPHSDVEIFRVYRYCGNCVHPLCKLQARFMCEGKQEKVYLLFCPAHKEAWLDALANH